MALSPLVLQISRKNLDEVRNCKTALNKLMTRIGKIKAVRICRVLSLSLQTVLQVLTVLRVLIRPLCMIQAAY